MSECQDVGAALNNKYKELRIQAHLFLLKSKPDDIMKISMSKKTNFKEGSFFIFCINSINNSEQEILQYIARCGFELNKPSNK